MGDLVELDPTRCRATSKQSGRQCMQPPIPGGTVCRFHGGGAPQVRRAAQERLAMEKVKTEVEQRLGGSLNVDPGDALLEMCHEAAFNVAYLRQRVGELDTQKTAIGDPSDIYGPTFHATGRATGEGKKHILVQMYDEERERLARFSKLAIDAGIAERRLELAEIEALRLAQVIIATVDDPQLGLTREQRELARRIAGQQMRFVSMSPRSASTPVGPGGNQL